MAKSARFPTLSLFLVRHAESQNNAINARYAAQGWEKFLRSPDPDLSETGNAQIAKLEAFVRESDRVTAAALRGAAAANNDRFLFFSSPMRRALKTSSALAKGLSYNGVIVDPTCFEEGGCYHDYVDMADMKGLERLEAMSEEELEQLKADKGQRRTFPGLTAADVLDPITLSAHLNVTPETASFVKEAIPGMEDGWYAAFDRCETRGECYARAKYFVEKVKAIAMADVADTCVLVSHGDLMDAMLKNLVCQPGVEDRVLDSAIRFAHTNTGITRVEIGKKDGMAHVMVMNESTHLEAADHTGGEMLDGWGKWREHAW